jgi:acetylornithine deacetylase/succinyl-diaminopimelate desuccinylase-like protein
MTNSIHDQIQDYLSQREQELIEIHRAIVQVPTINRGDGTSAEETRCAQVGAQYLKQASIDSEIAEGEPGRGNLLAELDGGNGGRKMLWMSHNDVVPVGDLAAWSHPPFSAEIANGRIWGRGSQDCKMLVAAQLFAMSCLKRLGLPKKGTLRLAIGADEEVGGALGFGWLSKNRTEFLKTDLAICEGGGGFIGRLAGDRPVISVGAGEKGRCDVTIRARSAGGHASTPWGKRNPLLVLAEAVRRLDAWRPEPAPASPLFQAMAPWFGMAAITKENVEAAIERIGQRVPALLSSLRGQSRMSVTPTVLHCGDKANAIPTEATLVCDARLLPGQTLADLEAVVRGVLAGLEDVEFTVSETSEPSLSPFDEGLRGIFERSASRAVGEPVEVAPVWCVGATDAHFVRAVGTPVYGFQVIDPKADPTKLSIHCVNESIEVGMLLPCALALAHFAADYLEQ